MKIRREVSFQACGLRSLRSAPPGRHDDSAATGSVSVPSSLVSEVPERPPHQAQAPTGAAAARFAGPRRRRASAARGPSSSRPARRRPLPRDRRAAGRGPGENAVLPPNAVTHDTEHPDSASTPVLCPPEEPPYRRRLSIPASRQRCPTGGGQLARGYELPSASSITGKRLASTSSESMDEGRGRRSLRYASKSKPPRHTKPSRDQSLPCPDAHAKRLNTARAQRIAR